MTVCVRALVCALALSLSLALAAAAAAAPLVRYERTGGIAGEMTTMKISPQGKVRVDRRNFEPRRFTLSAKKLRGVKNVLRDADFPSLDEAYEPEFVVNDGITVAVTYGGQTVSASTGGEPPERFERVLVRLGKIVE